MNIVTIFIIVFMPGGWVLFGLYKLYTMFIQKKSHDTLHINYMLSDLVMYRKGRNHKPYVGSFIKLTDDISRVTVSKEANLTREFYD